ncbi:hypothetical protein MY10362_003814 [Beauveria mimosiformis]
MSQVKNLRAMFESKGDTSPPDSRGRSPTGGSPQHHHRPFGRSRKQRLLYLHYQLIPRDKCHYLTIASVPGYSILLVRLWRRDGCSRAALPNSDLLPYISLTQTSPTAASATSEAPRPLSKIRTSFVAVEKDGRIGLKRDQSGESSVSRRRLSNDTEPSLYRSRSKMSTQDDSVRTPAPESIPEAPDAAETAVEQPSNISETASNAPAKAQEAAEVKPTTPRPTTTASKSASKTAPKSAASKTEPTKRPGNKPVASTRATGATTAIKKPASVKIGANDTGFVKPKPKSPTKPVNLPSSLMAPTAASAHKGGASRQANLPQSASAHAVGASAASKPVNGKSSIVNRQRPSLGVPSINKAAQESMPNKRQSHVDEGFLARMMRPTAASSSRTTEKGAPSTPPKKPTPRTSNIGVENVKRTSKSPVPRRAGSVARSREATSRAEKAHAKPATKTASSVAQEVAVPAAAAAAAVAAAVASEVVPDSTMSKLADKLQDLGIEESKQEPKEEPATKAEPETEQEPEFEAGPEAEPEPEAEEHGQDAPIEDPELEAEPEAEHDVAKEHVQKHAEECETVEDAQLELEEEHEAAPVGHIEEPEPIAEAGELVPQNIIDEPVEEYPTHEESASLEQAALEAAQVETAEEAIEIAEDADPKQHFSFNDVAKPMESDIDNSTIKGGVVGNGHVDKVDSVADVEPASIISKLAETTPEHGEKATDEVVGKDADTAA